MKDELVWETCSRPIPDRPGEGLQILVNGPHIDKVPYSVGEDPKRLRHRFEEHSAGLGKNLGEEGLR